MIKAQNLSPYLKHQTPQKLQSYQIFRLMFERGTPHRKEGMADTIVEQNPGFFYQSIP